MAATLPFTLTNGTPADADQVMADLNALLAAVNALVPPGSVHAYGGAAAPTGYLLCDGAAVSRVTYAALFSAIGTTYGVGDGSTTFNLPDLRGRVPIGVDGAAGRITANDALGQSGGSQTITFNDDNFDGSGVVKAFVSLSGSGPNLQPYQVLNYIIRT